MNLNATNARHMFLCLALFFALSGACAPSHADGPPQADLSSLPPGGAFPPTWEVRGTGICADSTSRLLWVKPGTYAADGYTGDTASVWNVDSSGNATSSGPAYGPYPGWYADSLCVAADGTTRIIWRTGDASTGEQVSIWRLTTTGVYASTGPVYGPYSGWFVDRASAAADGSIRLLWRTGAASTGESVTIWNVNPWGALTSAGAVYGPYPGWTTTALGVAADGSCRVLWVSVGVPDASGRESDTACVWNFNVWGSQTNIGPAYGPYSGWQSGSLAVAPNGTSRLLWRTGNAVSGQQITQWTLAASGAVSFIGPTYGPYYGWSVAAAPIARDGTSRLLWYCNTGASEYASIWNVGPTGAETSASPVYGPYDGWTIGLLTLAPDGTGRLLWANDGGGEKSAAWNVNSAGAQTLIGPVYGPYF